MPRRNVSRIRRAAALVLAAALTLVGSVTVAAAPATASTSQASIPDWGIIDNDGSPQLHVKRLPVCWANGDFPGSWDLPVGTYPAGLEVNFTNASTGFSKSYPVADQYFELSRATGQVYEATYRLNGQIIGQKSEVGVPEGTCFASASNGERAMEIKSGVPHNNGSPRVHAESVCWANGEFPGSWDLPVGTYPAGLQVNFTNDTTGFSKNYAVEDQYFEIPRALDQVYKVTYRLNDEVYGQSSELGMTKFGSWCEARVSNGERAMEFTEVRPVDWNAVRHIGQEKSSDHSGYVNVHLLKEAANSKFRYILERDGNYIGEYYQGKAYGMTMQNNPETGVIELQARQINLIPSTELKVYLATGEPRTTPELKAPLAVPVEDIKREGDNAAFTFDKNYYNSNARYIITIDGKYSGEIHNGTAYYTNGHRDNGDGTITLWDHVGPNGTKQAIAIHIAPGAPGDSTEGMHTITTANTLW